MSFNVFGLRSPIAAGIEACGYSAPTPIQQQALPPALSGRDVMGLAQTGTGKTAAFVLPILQRLSTGPRGRIRALILAPTRELAEQILSSINELGRRTKVRGVAVYGGVSKGMQLQKIRSGAEIVVACPGRLLDHLQSRAFRLDAVEVLVLDEADQMFDMGFLPDIRRILKAVPAQRQNMLFSATMPGDIRKLADEILQNPTVVRVDSDQPAATVDQTLFPVAQQRKTALLLSLLQQTPTESVLVFTRTKFGAKNLARRLTSAGYRAADLQGNLSQNKRRSTLDGFRDGSINILVATDIAARGLDVARVSHVINFDMPSTAEAYTHRIGRTGRATRRGEAFSLVGREDLGLVRAIERGFGKRLTRRTLEGFEAGVGEEAARPARSGGAMPKRPRTSPDTETRRAKEPGKSRFNRSGRPAGTGSGPGKRNPNGPPRNRRPRRVAPLGLGMGPASDRG